MLLTNERTKNQPKTMFFELEDFPTSYIPTKREKEREKALIDAYKEYKAKRLQIIDKYGYTEESAKLISDHVLKYNKHVKEINNKYKSRKA